PPPSPLCPSTTLFRSPMGTSPVRQLIVPAAGGAVAAFLVVGVLVTEQALGFNGAEFGTVVLGLMWLGPWGLLVALPLFIVGGLGDRKSTRLNSSHVKI